MNKQHEILQSLRRAITSGAIPPGGRLPAQEELARRFQVSGYTVHQALTQLGRDGYVVMRGRRGRFVVDVPPHLFHFSLVTSQPPRPSHRLHSLFLHALIHEATGTDQRGEVGFKVFYGIGERGEGIDAARLLAEIRAHRTGGLIFTNIPLAPPESPILSEPEIPRVAIMDRVNLGMPTVYVDSRSFLRKAVAALAGRGCRRVALVTTWEPSDLHIDLLRLELQARGVETRSRWIQHLQPFTAAGDHQPAAVANVVEAVMHGSPAERPDGLIVSDDNLLEGTGRGLVAAGVRPADLHVVAHCNYPVFPPCAFLVQRLGFSARQMLGACIERINQQRWGQPTPPHTLVPALFEEELTASVRPLVAVLAASQISQTGTPHACVRRERS